METSAGFKGISSKERINLTATQLRSRIKELYLYLTGIKEDDGLVTKMSKLEELNLNSTQSSIITNIIDDQNQSFLLYGLSRSNSFYGPSFSTSYPEFILAEKDKETPNVIDRMIPQTMNEILEVHRAYLDYQSSHDYKSLYEVLEEMVDVICYIQSLLYEVASHLIIINTKEDKTENNISHFKNQAVKKYYVDNTLFKFSQSNCSLYGEYNQLDKVPDDFKTVMFDIMMALTSMRDMYPTKKYHMAHDELSIDEEDRLYTRLEEQEALIYHTIHQYAMKLISSYNKENPHDMINIDLQTVYIRKVYANIYNTSLKKFS